MNIHSHIDGNKSPNPKTSTLPKVLTDYCLTPLAILVLEVICVKATVGEFPTG